MKKNPNSQDRRTGRLRPLLSAILLIAVATGIVLSIKGAQKTHARRKAHAAMPVFAAVRGPLTISVTETGTIQSRDKVVIMSEVEGRNTLVFIAEEGSIVEAGDPLVELDASKLEEGRIDQEISVQNAEAAFIGATETLAITRNQSDADTQQAELDLKFAKLALEKYEKGEYPMEHQEAQSKITLAEEELKKAEDQYTWSKQLHDEGYVTRSELLADELSVNRKRIDLQTARETLKVLENYTYEEQMEKLKSEVTQATMALERVKRKATADIVKDEADVRAKKSEFERQKSKLDKVVEQIALCKITAPAAGMVVYATTGGSRWHRSEEPLAVGQEISERQELIHLPTTAEMKVVIRVKESGLPKIKEGQQVMIEVDALPDRRLRAELTKIAVLPDSTRSWLNPDLKVYNCDAEIETAEPALRPGMSCRAEILIEELEDIVYVPIQSVIRVGDQPTVYVMTPEGPQPRKVEAGLDNNRMIHITQGLEAGEKVWLAPPLKDGAKPSARRVNGTRGSESKPAKQKPTAQTAREGPPRKRPAGAPAK